MPESMKLLFPFDQFSECHGDKKSIQPSRCCDDDVRSVREFLTLVDHVFAADNDTHVQIHGLPDHFELKIKKKD